ncbi:MAG TPA: hypothetical protein VG502_18400 [Flexivirga sp.]|uniref:hypothetical protein n=1 Tax=Flexivirga sp. TaxID=1962927 RepID=UPI002CABE7AC|nr:hypothetical protein [Flexivirga sp.]HWC24271.1 hypothetical protein [Flexivirga sp.]
MSTSVSGRTTTPANPAIDDASAADSTGLRNLYLVRFGFAVLWAVLFAISASTINVASVILLLVYPLFDVAAAVVDVRSSDAARLAAPLRINMALSALATVGLAVAAGSGFPAVLRVWGAWAITAGVVQLVVALGRRRMGGQWAMIASGAISAVAGTTFVIQAGRPDPSLASLAGYATLGGIFFLVSALRLRRAAR